MTPTKYISREEVMNILINYGPSVDRYHYQELLHGIDNLSSLPDNSSQIGDMIKGKIEEEKIYGDTDSEQNISGIRFLDGKLQTSHSKVYYEDGKAIGGGIEWRDFPVNTTF